MKSDSLADDAESTGSAVFDGRWRVGRLFPDHDAEPGDGHGRADHDRTDHDRAEHLYNNAFTIFIN